MHRHEPKRVSAATPFVHVHLGGARQDTLTSRERGV